MSTAAAGADLPKGGKGKGKKSGKGEKLDLEKVLGQTTNWNVIMENDDEDDYNHRAAPIELPSAPKSLTTDSDLDQIPNHGPFKAYVSNIAYELTEDEVGEAFNSFRVLSVSLVRDARTQQPRGVTIEFETRKDLIDAINTMNGKSLKNRNIRVQVSNQILPDRGYGDRMGDRGRRGFGGMDTTPSDWRSGPARDTVGHGGRVLPPPSYEDSRGGYGGGRRREEGGFGGMSYAPPPSRDDDYGGFDRGGFGGRRDRDYGRDRDRGGQWGRGGGDEEMGGNWRSSAREPALAPPPEYNQPRRSYEPPRDSYREREAYHAPQPAPAHHDDFRRDDYGGGGGRREEYYNPPRDYELRDPPSGVRERFPSTRSVDSHGHSGGEDYVKSDEDGSVKGASRRSTVPLSALKALVLDEQEEPNKPASYNSIFGSAKPVDTLKKEQEIEQKLASSKAAALVPNSERPPPDDHRSTRRDRDRVGARRENGRRDGPRYDERNGALAGERRRRDDRRGERVERRDDRRAGGREGFGYASADTRGGRPGYDDRRVPRRDEYSRVEYRERYSSGGSDYPPEEGGHNDIKPNYATSNKFDRLNDAEDHVSDD